MAKQKIQVGVTVWKRFITYDFAITASLPGSAHKFVYKDYPITIELPARPPKKNEEDWESRIYCRSWKKTSEGLRPRGYEVNDVDVYLDTKRMRLIPDDPIKRRQNSLFDKRERESLEQLKAKFEKIVDEAFSYWVDVLRWKTGSLGSCRYITEMQKNSWGVGLLETKTKERFFSGMETITVSAGSYISKKHWNAAQEALSSTVVVPIWHLYLAEADHQLRIGQTRRAILDLNISVESLVRELVRVFLSGRATPKFQKKVNNISLSGLLKDWRSLGFGAAHWRKYLNNKSLVLGIVENRNAIMHRGEDPILSDQERSRLFAAVKNFIEAGDLELKRYSSALSK